MKATQRARLAMVPPTVDVEELAGIYGKFHLLLSVVPFIFPPHRLNPWDIQAVALANYRNSASV